MDCSQPGSSVLGISQARILERLATIWHREFSSVICDDTEGWDAEGDRWAQEERDIRTI